MTTQRRSRFKQVVLNHLLQAEVKLLLAALRGLFSYAQLFIISRAGYQMVYALLRELFGHLQRLSLSLHNLDVTPVTKETSSMEKASTARRGTESRHVERNHRGYRLGQSARASVVREHTWDAVARRILGLAGLKPEPKSQPRTVESII